MHNGFDVEINFHDQAWRAIGPIAGVFGEMPCDAHSIAKAVAEELALEHLSSYGGKRSKR